MSPEIEEEIRVALANNEYIANSAVRELLAAYDELRSRIATSEKLELRALRERDAIRDSARNLRVLRSSCDDSHDGAFRVHLSEREWDDFNLLLGRRA